MNEIDFIATQLDLSLYKEDVNRFSELMTMLHPKGCIIKEEMNETDEFLYVKIPKIIPAFINEMEAKYDDPKLALALLARISAEYLNFN